MASLARLRATAKYEKKVYKKYTFRIRKDIESAIITHLDSQVNKNDYIKRLIVTDMIKK